jgi:hypothetical protein
MVEKCGKVNSFQGDGVFMQYCNDCFAKMGDDEKHCKSCKSRDIRPFDSEVSADTHEGNGSETYYEQTSSKIKVNPIYLVEPKEKPSSKHEAPLLHFPPSPKEAKRQEKQNEINRKASGAASLNPIGDARNARRRRNRRLIWVLLAVAPIAFASFQLAQAKDEVSISAIWETLKADVNSVFAKQTSLAEPTKASKTGAKPTQAVAPKKPAVQVWAPQDAPITESERAAVTTLYYDAQQSISLHMYQTGWNEQTTDFVVAHNFPGMFEEKTARGCLTDKLFMFQVYPNPDLYSLRRDTQWTIPSDVAGNLLAGTRPKADVFILTVNYPTYQTLEHVAVSHGKAYRFQWVCGR